MTGFNDRFLDPLKRRIHLMLARAVLTSLSDDGARQYVGVDVLRGENKDKVERVGEYGFSSHPLAGAQVIMISLGGNRDHPVVIAIDDPRVRHTGLEAGEVCIYTDEGDEIVLKRGREIHIKAGTKIRIETPLLEVTGEIKDRCNTGGRTMHEMRDVYDEHTHPENDSGGPTDAPNQKMEV